MRVRCIDNIDAARPRRLADGRLVPTPFPQLTVGKIYTLLRHNNFTVDIIADDGAETAFNWARFCIVYDDPTPDTVRRFARVIDDRRCSYIRNGDVFEVHGEVYENGY